MSRPDRAEKQVPKITNKKELERKVAAIRATLAPAFSQDTAAAGFPTITPSGGHCGVVAAITYMLLGGKLVSARVGGISHWFNRVKAGTELFDIDLTSDQFGFAPYLLRPVNELYSGTRQRPWADLNKETLSRAERLAARAGLADVDRRLEEALEVPRR